MKYLWLLTLIPIYPLFLAVRAWIAVKATPREEMFWCSKHGAIRSSGTIEFIGVRSCGLCFHETMRRAERGNT